MTFALLQIAERAYVFQNSIEVVFAADFLEALGIGCIERNTQFIQPSFDQRTAAAFARESVPLVLNSV